MKVGILTFHNAHNYGAVLQAYALKTCVKQLGHEVRIVRLLCAQVPPRVWLAGHRGGCRGLRFLQVG